MKRIVVIGNGMVGHKFVDLLNQQAHDCEVTVFCEEPRLAYDRVQLSSYFSGTTAEELALADGDAYTDWSVTTHLSAPVTAIDRDHKTVTDSNGISVSYDTLLLATGSFPFVPPIPGSEQEHCLVYRTIEDLQAMEASGKTSKVGVVVGGGLLGLEAANALKNMGLETHVVEFAPQLMAVQVDEGGGALLREKIESLGVAVHTGCNTELIAEGEERRRMNFAGGDYLETDMIVFSAGIRPRDQLARESGLEVGNEAVSSSTTTVEHPIPIYLLSVNVRCGKARSLGWWPPVMKWRGWLLM